jgi:uncharacterized protein involved in exopolysaccharide biosynthesis
VAASGPFVTASSRRKISPRVHEALEAPLRRPRLVLAAILVFLGSAIAAGGFLPQRYRATARLQTDWAQGGDTQSAPAGADRQLRAARSRVLSAAAVDEVLAQVWVGEPSRVDDRTALGDVELRLGPGGVLSLECLHPDPRAAAAVANGLAAHFVAENERTWRGRGDVDRLAARVAQARHELDEVVARTGAGPREVSPPSTDGADAPEAQRQRVQAELSAARARADRLRRGTDAQATTPAPSQESPLAAEIEALRQELERLRQRYTDEHPDVLVVLRRLQRLEAAAPAPHADPPLVPSAVPGTELEAVEREIEALEIRSRELESRAARQARTGPGSADRRHSPRGERDQAQATYVQLMAEWREAERIASLQPVPLGRVEILDEAQVPDEPESPDRLLLGLAGVGLGLAVGLLLAIVAEWRDRSVKTVDELSELLDSPVLAVVPLVRGGSDVPPPASPSPLTKAQALEQGRRLGS